MAKAVIKEFLLGNFVSVLTFSWVRLFASLGLYFGFPFINLYGYTFLHEKYKFVVVIWISLVVLCVLRRPSYVEEKIKIMDKIKLPFLLEIYAAIYIF